ncbi:response regulator transcription factor [Vibrio sp. S9_S30]|uniref:response regulator n=1 Tax=Vibrio sp. S9_S30 TaxID=2720226 RepID=UPI001680A254|nr:response regulator transcription factor [Vibrio sp. S9_S30]MBD1556570.1 response regulator transcription factor [Vibrio sp. S9_S30]
MSAITIKFTIYWSESLQLKEKSTRTVVVVDDDQDIREILGDALSQHGHNVILAENGAQLMSAFEQDNPDVILLDLRLKQEDGLQLAKEIREQSAVPIMMLTGKGDETDRIIGLEIAADDYMMKPFNLRELIARVNALLRRSDLTHIKPVQTEHIQYCFGPWRLNMSTRQLLNESGEEVSLTYGEFALLQALISSPNCVLSRDQLMDKTHGFASDSSDRTVDVLILRLRRKIESNPRLPKFIQTERGVGYMFSSNVVKIG